MRIELFGTAFSIQTDEDPEYLQRVVDHFQKRATEIQSSVGTSDSLKVAILTGLQVTDELFKAQEQPELNSTVDRLISAIDDILPDTPSPADPANRESPEHLEPEA